MLSFWEKKHFIHYDHIIIGGGVTGLSAACGIKEKHPGARVLVLEKGLFPSGSGAKGLGLASFGSFSEMCQRLELEGEDKFLAHIERLVKGMGIMRKRLGDDNIDYHKNGDFELVLNRSGFDVQKIERVNAALRNIFDENVFHSIQQLVGFFEFNPEMVSGVIVNPLDGQLNPGMLMQTLTNYAGILQIRVIHGAEVIHLEERDKDIEVTVRNGEESLSFCGGKVAICTGSGLKRLYPDHSIPTCREHLLCTSPVDDLKLKGIFSFESGKFYFRNYENRIMFGGIHHSTETDTAQSQPSGENIQQQMEFYLEEMIIPGKRFHTDYSWASAIPLGKSRSPLFEKISPRIIAGVTRHSSDIGVAHKVAEDVCNMMLSE